MPTDQPSIFLSYSRKGADENALKAVLDECRAAVEEQNWKVIDPMTRVSVDTIDKKVFDDLLSADALIAEATTSVPNVMFEIGLARALGYPIITLVNSDVPKEGDKSLKDYFAFIGTTPEKPLPSDLGNRELIEYTNDMTKPGGSDAIRASIEELLGTLKMSWLSPGACRLRKQCHRMLATTDQIMGLLRDDHPQLRFIAGWFEHATRELASSTEIAFELDAHYYPSCLKAFQDWDRGGGRVWAVADLADSTESFWDHKPSPVDTAVSERVFLVPWRTFFDRRKLAKTLDTLKGHQNRYKVLLGCSEGGSDREAHPHPFGAECVAEHLLVIQPDLVGGYVQKQGRKFLRVARDSEQFKQATARYQTIRNRSLELDPEWDELQVRGEWIRSEGIGDWDPRWADNPERPWSYYNNYDQHIRAWVPDYDNLIRSCARAAQREIMRLLVGTTGSLKILEVGVGTGALTRAMLKWITTLDRPFELAPESRPVTEFWGVDRSKEMVSIAKEQLGDQAQTRVLLKRWTAFESPPPEIERKRPFDVIFGSLVFHDLVDPENEGSVVHILEQAAELLSDHGRLVFADVFPSREKGPERQIGYWKQRMLGHGLSEEQVDRFLEGNEDMAKAITEDVLDSAAKDAGFVGATFGTGDQDSQSPFRIATVRRRLTEAEELSGKGK